MPRGSFVITPKLAARDIVYDQVKLAGVEPTEDEKALIVEIERTLRALRAIYEGRDAEFAVKFDELASLAKAGLEGAETEPRFAMTMLDQLRSGILEREAGPMKNRYMATLGAACLRFGLPPLVLALLIRVGSEATATEPARSLKASNLLLVIAACAAGVWVSFGARKAQITFDDLTTPERDFLYPASRLAFATILTLAVALIFHSGAAAVNVGAFSTRDVFAFPGTAIVVGFLCGFSEQVLAKAIQTQAARIIGV